MYTPFTHCHNLSVAFLLIVTTIQLIRTVEGNAASSGTTTSSPDAAFLSPGSSVGDEPCSGPNGKSGVLRKRALVAYPRALQPRSVDQEIYCSIEQRLTANQVLPSVTSAAQDNVQIGQPATTTPGATYNPNDLTPTQMSQLLGALQPAQSNTHVSLALSTSASEKSDLSSSMLESSMKVISSSHSSKTTSPNQVPTSSTLISSRSAISTTKSAIQKGSPSSESSRSITVTNAAISNSNGSSSTTGNASNGAPSKTEGSTNAANVTTGVTISSTSGAESTSRIVQGGYNTIRASSATGLSPVSMESSLLGLAPTTSSFFNQGPSLKNTSTVGTGSTGSIPSVVGSGSYATPPYPIPPAILPPGHQLPTGIIPLPGPSNNSTHDGSSVLTFTGQGSKMWDSMGGWRSIAGAGSAVAFFAFGFL